MTYDNSEYDSARYDTPDDAQALSGFDQISAPKANLAVESETKQDSKENFWQELVFLVVTAVVLVADMVSFSYMETWMAPLVIGVIELVCLLILAKRCGIEEIQELLDKVFAIMDKYCEKK